MDADDEPNPLLLAALEPPGPLLLKDETAPTQNPQRFAAEADAAPDEDDDPKLDSDPYDEDDDAGNHKPQRLPGPVLALALPLPLPLWLPLLELLDEAPTQNPHKGGTDDEDEELNET